MIVEIPDCDVAHVRSVFADAVERYVYLAQPLANKAPSIRIYLDNVVDALNRVRAQLDLGGQCDATADTADTIAKEA